MFKYEALAISYWERQSGWVTDSKLVQHTAYSVYCVGDRMEKIDENGGGVMLEAFAKKCSASDNREYSVEEAESRDFIYLLENSCLECNRAFSGNETKIIPPSYIQERDVYVRTGIVYKRYMCIACYNTVRSPQKLRVKIKYSLPLQARLRKARMIKTLLNEMLVKQ